MSNKLLYTQVDVFFEDAISLTCNCSSLRKLQRILEEQQRQLQKPMQVAIVGKIKAGKSTMLNALLGEALVATGAVEATFNVNWLKYSEKKFIKVHYKDENRSPEVKSIQDLESLTRRPQDSSEQQEELLAIKYIEVYYPNPLLKQLDLIDTPGLASAFQNDEKNTRNFLQIHGEELTQTTQSHTREAHAVIYLFKQNPADKDKKVMEEFLGPGMEQTTPFNAIGVLTRTDDYWPSVPEPMQAGQRIAHNLMEKHADLHNIFYTIHPVSGFLAWGAQTLLPEEFEILKSLAALPEERLTSLLRSAERFTERPYPDKPEIPGIDDRKKIYDRLNGYGIYLACQKIRSGRISDLESLSDFLLEKSGVQELKKLIQEHFGNRAFLIKFKDCSRRLKYAIDTAKRQQIDRSTLDIIETIHKSLEEIECDTLFPRFRELEAVKLHYHESKIRFEEEEYEQFLQVIGEKGKSCTARLGLSEQATIPEMLLTAHDRKNLWRQRANNPFLSNAETAEAASTVTTAYEYLINQIEQAQQILISSSNLLYEEWENLAADLEELAWIPDFSICNSKLHFILQTDLESPEDWSVLRDLLKTLQSLCFREQQEQKGAARKQLQQLAERIEKLEVNEHGLQEQVVRELFQAQQLTLDERAQTQLHELLDQANVSCAAKLGLPEKTPLAELQKLVEDLNAEWLARSHNSFWIDSQTQWAAGVVARSYEQVKYQLLQASQQLNFV